MPIRIRAKKKLPDGEGYAISGFNMVPCGKCYKCKLRRVNDWVIRLQTEDRQYFGGLFCTLTYDNENCPITPKKLKTVCKYDLQKFFKRLRKNTGKKIKYYAVAEYGSKTYRPHYHIIFFGVNAEDITNNWHSGHVHVGSVTEDSIAYSLKYILKDSQIPQFEGDDRTPEFRLSSQKIGISYLTRQKIQYHKANLASFYTKEGGYLAPLPRYYRDRIFDESEKKLIFEGMQDKNLTKYNQLIDYYGSHEEYYRIKGEQVRFHQFKHKLLKNESDTL